MMRKFTEAYRQQHFRSIIKYGEKLKTDKGLVEQILREHLSYLPNGKLYKYRECSEDNFSTLVGQNIWMSKAEDFKDLFDYTLNYDLKKNDKEIKKWLYNNINEFIIAFLNTIYKDNGVTNHVNIEHLNNIRDIYFSTDESQVDKRVEKYLCDNCTKDEYCQSKKIYDLMKSNFSKEELAELAITVKEMVYIKSNAIRKKALIYCMTEEHDNRSLWEHYASDYSGFCIEYDFRNAFEVGFNDYKNLIYLMPMHYLKKKPYFDIVPFIDGATRRSIFKETEYKHDEKLQIQLNEQLFMKNKAYSSEKEWRFSIKNDGANLQHFPFVSGIYIGHKTSNSNFEQLSSIAKNLNVTLYKQSVNNAGTDFEYIVL